MREKRHFASREEKILLGRLLSFTNCRISTISQRQLKIVFSGKLLILDNLDPVAIRVQEESHVLHSAVRQSLLPVDVQVLKALAGSTDVVDGDT